MDLDASHTGYQIADVSLIIASSAPGESSVR